MIGKVVLALFGGYLLGSFSTAYWIGKWLAGIDIREHGDGNAGTVNASKVLGLRAGVVVALVDLSKGILAYWIALLLGLNEWLAYLSGMMAILGHIAPFYLRFRGGQGAGTATGLLLYTLGRSLVNGWFPVEDLLFLAWIVAVFTWISMKGEIIGCCVLPVLELEVLTRTPPNPTTATMAVLVAFLLVVNLFNLFHRKVLALREEVRTRIKWIRFGLRPAALAFPAAEQWLGDRVGVGLVSAVTLTAVAGDAIRLARQSINQAAIQRISAILKEKEAHRFSSISLFLLACAITLIVFPLPLAWLAISYLIFGDMFAKFFGLQFGRRPFFHKTIEGTLACFAACSIVAFYGVELVGIPFGVAIAGALGATLAESLPLGVDDNLSMSLISAATMFGFLQF